MIRRSLRLASVALCALAAPLAFADATPVVVAAGVNTSFDAALGTLNYAETDAERFTNVMATAGGTDLANLTLLRSPTAEEFIQAVKDRVRTAAKPARLVLYFSGHADDRGLHFRYGPLPMARLRALLTELDVPTKVLFIDSCFSGSIATKGVVSAEAFDLPKLDTDELSGSVFLTASSAREAAYESTQLSGSLFTHYVISGLNGASDSNNDGLVTVEELYQFVYRETRLQTLAYPAARSQHPEYHADLHGRGALVLAKPRVLLGKIRIDPGVIGTVRLMSLSGIGSFSIPYGSSPDRNTALPEGSYRALVRRGDQIGEASISIVRGATTELRPRQFAWHPIDMELASNSKGAASSLTAPIMAMVSLGRTLGGPLALETLDASFAKAMVSNSTISSKWTILAQGGVFQSDGALLGHAVSNLGANLGVGVVQAWTGVAMRGTLGLNLTRNWQKLDEGNFTYRHSTATNPGGYVGFLFPIGQSLIGQFNLAARLSLSPLQDLDGANRNASQYLFGVEVEP